MLWEKYFDRRMAAIGYTAEFLINKQVAKLKEGKILDLGCGSGRVLLPLLSEMPDLKAVGVDICPIMMDIGKENLKAHTHQCELILGDMTEYKKEAYFDVAFCGHNTLSMITDATALKRMFKNIFDSLKNGGEFIFAIDASLSRVGMYHEKYLWDGETVKFVTTATENGNDRKYSFNITSDSASEIYIANTKIITEEEITALASEAGFRGKSVYGDMEGSRRYMRSSHYIMNCLFKKIT